MRLTRLPAMWLSLVFAALTLGPLLLLTYVAVTRSTNAVEQEANAGLSSTALASSGLVATELKALRELVAAYARRSRLVDALRREPSPARTRMLRRQLGQLKDLRSGIAVAFLAEPSGRLLEVVPETPSVVGKDFSFRDWYRGVSSSRKPYISRVYVSAATGRERVVAAAALVPGDTPNRPLAILVAGYSTAHLHSFTHMFAAEQGVTLTVTDQAGVVVVGPVAKADGATSLANQPHIAAALRGETGVASVQKGNDPQLTAFAPVPGIGWTVTSSVPRAVALARAERLRKSVLAIAALLAFVLMGGVGLLAFTLRRREEAERREQAALRATEARNIQLQEAHGEAQRLAEINGAVLDATADAIRMVDLEGNTVAINRAMRTTFADLLRLSDTGSIWERIDSLAARTADPAGYQHAARALRDDPSREAVDEYELVDVGIWIHRYSAPVRSEDGAIVGRIFVLRDVTRERQAERVKSELVATVSHELRTPLTGVLGFAELLAAPGVDAETRQQYAETIAREAQRLRDLLNDFADLQRIEDAELKLTLEPVALNELIAAQAPLYAVQSSAHRIELALEPELEVLADRDRVVQVLANLLTNAIKYSPGGGTVEVTANGVGAAVRISIRDEGLGIPAGQRERVFEKFFRVDCSETQRIGGTGLGLALVRELVEAHGGRVGVESTEGRGSTFWFELPRGDSAEGALSPPLAAQRASAA